MRLKLFLGWGQFGRLRWEGEESHPADCDQWRGEEEGRSSQERYEQTDCRRVQQSEGSALKFEILNASDFKKRKLEDAEAELAEGETEAKHWMEKDSWSCWEWHVKMNEVLHWQKQFWQFVEFDTFPKSQMGSASPSLILFLLQALIWSIWSKTNVLDKIIKTLLVKLWQSLEGKCFYRRPFPKWSR